MNLNKTQKETCAKMVQGLIKNDPNAKAFFERLKEPLRSAYFAERDKLIGTVQHNEFGIPDEPSLTPNQISSIVKNTRKAYEGDQDAKAFIERVNNNANEGMAYAQAMMRVYHAVAERIEKEKVPLRHGVRSAVKPTLATVEMKDGAPHVTVSQTTPSKVETVPAPEEPKVYSQEVKDCAEQVQILLNEFTPSLEHSSLTKAYQVLKGLQEKDPVAVHHAAEVFEYLFLST